MRSAPALWGAAAAVLLAAVGCDYWNNLVEEKSPTLAELDVKVVDAWTGEALGGAVCKDSLQGASATADDQGAFRIEAAATGRYAFRCGHEWYYDGVAGIHLTKDGTHAVVKLARKGLSDWYPEPFRKVAIPRPANGQVRFPVDLDWPVTPSDSGRKFRYEWSFLRTERLNHGHRMGNEQLDSESYRPRYRNRAAPETGVQAGPDTAVLKVYSLLNGDEYLVGSDTMPFVWVRNRKPYVQFDSLFKQSPPTYRVGCGSATALVSLTGDDSDGQCTMMRFWTKNAPSVGKRDTLLSCEQSAHILRLPLTRPSQPGRPRINGSEEYENTLYVEITDDNGETARDSVAFLTYTNAPPSASIRIVNPQAAYFTSEPIIFEVSGHDRDGGVRALELISNRSTDGALLLIPWESPDFPYDSAATFRFTPKFDEADTYKSQGRAIDDCDDSGSVDGPHFIVRKNSPPSIQITGLQSLPKAGGDSLWVQFNLSVKDDDVSYGDSLTAVHVIWDYDGTQNDPRPSDIYPKTTQYEHTFASPQPGAKLSITVVAYDAHSGETYSIVQVP